MFYFFLGCLVPIGLMFVWKMFMYKKRMIIEFWEIPENGIVCCVGKVGCDFPIPQLNSFVLSNIGESCKVLKISYDYSNKRIVILLTPEAGKDKILGKIG